MATVIYKYELKFEIKPVVHMPFDAKILSVQIQNERFVLWALVDTEKPIVGTEFFFIGTGIEFDDYFTDLAKNGFLDHIATIQSGSLVYHLFENTSPF